MSRLAFPGFVFCVAVAALTAACASPGATADGQNGQTGRGGATTPTVPVEVASAVQKTVPLDLQVIGTVEPVSTVSVHAQATGLLETVGFREGDEVRKGDVLFRLDERPLEAAVKQAEASLERDQAQAANADAQAQRLRDLQTRGIATREQLDTSRANADALTATLGADQAALDNTKLQLQYATIVAPLTGRTGALMVHAGSLVRANDTTPLVVINQLAPISVSFAIPEAQLSTLKRYVAKGPVTVKVASPESGAAVTEGRVSFIDNAVDPTTGTIRVKAAFSNGDHRLWPGQYVNVALTLANDPDAIVVPTIAVQNSQDGTYVFVITKDQIAEMRTVTVKRASGNESVIASGLRAGEVVVTDGHLRIVPGGKVAARPSTAVSP